MAKKSLWRRVSRWVRGEAIWDGAKEAARLMIPFIAAFGIGEWLKQHSVPLLWAAAFVVAVALAFFQRRQPAQGVVPDSSGTQPPQQPSSSQADMRRYHHVRSLFNGLRWDRKVALKLIAIRGPVDASSMLNELNGMGFAEPQAVVDDLLNKDLIESGPATGVLFVHHGWETDVTSLTESMHLFPRL